MQMKLMRKSIQILIMIVSLSAGNMYAQRTLIDVSIDHSAILIGEQTMLHLTITSNPDNPVIPIFPVDTLMRGVEVLAYAKADSSLIENNRLVVKQDILITSFDSALYLLPPFQLIEGMDTISSNQVALKVSSVPVDVENPDEFYDIKTVWKPPFVWADYYPLIFGILLFLLLICAIVYIIKRLKNKKSILPLKKSEPKLPPHQQALLELDEIKQKKLWQQGRIKDYYTAVTDTLRRYIEDRFGENAMEMTSGEILEIIRRENDADSVYESLKQILQLSDLVKFAKWNPLPDENDLSLMNAYLFVNQTKIEEVPAPGEKPDKETDEKETNNETLKNE